MAWCPISTSGKLTLPFLIVYPVFWPRFESKTPQTQSRSGYICECKIWDFHEVRMTAAMLFSVSALCKLDRCQRLEETRCRHLQGWRRLSLKSWRWRQCVSPTAEIYQRVCTTPKPRTPSSLHSATTHYFTEFQLPLANHISSSKLVQPTERGHGTTNWRNNEWDNKSLTMLTRKGSSHVAQALLQSITVSEMQQTRTSSAWAAGTEEGDSFRPL
jgi:hypothetical protein